MPDRDIPRARKRCELGDMSGEIAFDARARPVRRDQLQEVSEVPSEVALVAKEVDRRSAPQRCEKLFREFRSANRINALLVHKNECVCVESLGASMVEQTLNRLRRTFYIK